LEWCEEAARSSLPEPTGRAATVVILAKRPPRVRSRPHLSVAFNIVGCGSRYVSLTRRRVVAGRASWPLAVAVGGGGDDLGAGVGDDHVVLVVGAADSRRFDAPLDSKAHARQDHGR
jgi:hypothetical protein